MSLPASPNKANSGVNTEATTKIGISSGVSMTGSVSLGGYVLDLAAKGPTT